MTTTKELRQALLAVEPTVRSVDVDAVRLRARRVRRNRRIAAAVGGCAAVAAVAAGVPTLVPQLPHDGANASLPMSRRAPEAGTQVVAPDEVRDKKLTPRTGALATVRTMGPQVDVAVAGSAGYTLWVAPPGAGQGAGQFCFQRYTSGSKCTELKRNDRGFVSHVAESAPDDGVVTILVVEQPVSRVVGVSNQQRVATTVLDLGLGYAAAVAVMPRGAKAKPQAPAGGSSPFGVSEQVWALDNRSRLVAHHQLTLEAMPPGVPRTARGGVPRTVEEAEWHKEQVAEGDPIPRSIKGGPRITVAPGVQVSLNESVGPLFCIHEGPTAGCPMLQRGSTGWLYAGIANAPKGKSIWLGVLRKPVASVVAATEERRQVPVTVKDMGQGFVLVFAVTPDSIQVHRVWAFDDQGRLIAAPFDHPAGN